MSGFPTRTGRGGYGPNPVNSRPVRDPARQLDGETIGRLMFWQLGGLGLLSPIAALGATVAGSAITLGWHAEAFQPTGGNGPSLEYASTGVFTLRYAQAYPDETANPVPLVLRSGVAVAMGENPLFGQAQIANNGYEVTVQFWGLPDVALADPPAFFLVLW